MASNQVSGVLASAIIVRARYYLNEATASFWTDAELLTYLNDGTLDVVSRTNCLEAVETEQLVENQITYALSDPYIAIRTVIYDKGTGNEKGLLRGSLQQIGHKDKASGEPVYWTQDQDNVIVYPKPNAANSGTGKNIDVYTVKRPAAVAAGAAVLVPACYDRALILYIVAQAWYKDGQFGKSSRFMAEYLAELDRFRLDFVTVQKETVEVVK